MTQVYLEIQNGLHARQRVWVRLGQVVQVGSSDLADVKIQGDARLAQVHFRIGHQRGGCFVEGVSPEAMLLVEGKATQRRRLHDGELLQAGLTRFLVHISESSTAKAVQSAPAGTKTWPLPEPVATNSSPEEDESLVGESATGDTVAPEAPAGSGYLVEPLSDFVWCLIPDAREPLPTSTLLRRVFHAGHAVAIIHRDCGAAEDQSDDRTLPHFLHEAVIVKELNCADELVDVFQRCRGRNGLVVALSKVDAATLVEQLKPVAFSFTRPLILSTQIAVATAAAAKSLMADLHGVLLCDGPHPWQLLTCYPPAEAWVTFELQAPPANLGEHT